MKKYRAKEETKCSHNLTFFIFISFKLKESKMQQMIIKVQ